MLCMTCVLSTASLANFSSSSGFHLAASLVVREARGTMHLMAHTTNTCKGVEIPGPALHNETERENFTFLYIY